jgi:L,D-transpeptidase ErfK/SrfK
MPVEVKDGVIRRSFMMLCMGTAALLAALQFSGLTFQPRPQPVGILRPGRPSSLARALPSPAVAPSPQPVSTTVAEIGTRLVVKLSDRQVYFYRDDRLVNKYPVAVGILDKEQDPTFIHPITQVEVPPGPDNPLGKAWIGFWTDGNTEIGFHGTNQEELIGQAVSHGCIRMRNEDVMELFAQVDVGTPVSVEH